MSSELSLKQQLIDALGLGESDFYYQAGSLHVRDDQRVMPWLRNNWQFWTIVQRFKTTTPWTEGELVIPHQPQ